MDEPREAVLHRIERKVVEFQFFCPYCGFSNELVSVEGNFPECQHCKKRVVLRKETP